MNMSQTEKILAEKFDIIECLKKDEICSVYRAMHRFLAKEIILKTMDTVSISDPANISRFKREGRILARLDHPNIIRVLDFGNVQNVLYISFEFFKSRNLRQLAQERKLSAHEKLNLTGQMLRGVATAHEKGIIHRDLKPENILVSDSLELKIADFGLALASGESALTQKSSILGTPGYMSPEQIRGENLSARTDIFSLGIIIYELYSGKNPFMANDLNTTLNRILNFDFNSLPIESDDFPPEIRTILTKSLQNESDLRAENAGKLKTLLLPGSGFEKKGSRVWRYAFSALLLIILTSIPLILWQISDEGDKYSGGPPAIIVDSSQNTAQTVSDPVDTTGKILVQAIPAQNSIKQTEVISKTANTNLPNPATGKFKIYVTEPVIIGLDASVAVTFRRDTVLELTPGKHQIEIIHPDYPAYMYDFIINAGEIAAYKIDPAGMYAYFHCTVYPWGDVFIDSQHIAQTPFFNPVRVRSGIHLLQVKNPGFTTYSDSISIAGGDTLRLRINLESDEILN